MSTFTDRQEWEGAGVGFSCLWSETYIATAAVSNLAHGDKMAVRSRSPEIMADDDPILDIFVDKL